MSTKTKPTAAEKKAALMLEAKETFKRWASDRDGWLVVDTETTGRGTTREVIEIAIRDGYGVLLFHSLIKPVDEDMNPEVPHNLTMEDLKDAPTWADVWNQLQPLLTQKPLLMYNAKFHTRLIRQTCQKWNLPEPEMNAACVMDTYRKLTGSARAVSLEAASGNPVVNRAREDSQTLLSLILREGKE